MLVPRLRLPRPGPGGAVFHSGCLTGVVGPVSDHRRRLLPEERPVVTRAVDKRVREFSSGRHYVRIALLESGQPPVAIPAASDRAPVWPAGVVGSISHSDDLALVVLSACEAVAGIGVDVERVGRVPPTLDRSVLTTGEAARLRAQHEYLEDPRTLLFSVKEAVFKAIYPLARRLIGHTQVDVRLDPQNATFRATYIGADPCNRLLENGWGTFDCYHGHVVTCFWILK